MQVRNDGWAMTPAAAARSVLALHWNGMLPVDPISAATARGARVLAMGSRDQPWNLSGSFVEYDPIYGCPVIRYNKADVLVRQRFTVAHELGHFILEHGDAFRDDPSKYNIAVKDPKERDANQFAAELLMPRDAVKKLVENGYMTHVEELARAFQVSPLAMEYRLDNLGLRW